VKKENVEGHTAFQPEMTSPGRELDDFMEQMPPLTPRTETVQFESDIQDCYLSESTMLMSSNPILSPTHAENQRLLSHQMSLTLTQYSPPESLIEPSSIKPMESASAEAFAACDPYHLIRETPTQARKLDTDNNDASNSRMRHHSISSAGQENIKIDPQLLNNPFGSGQFDSANSPMSTLLQAFQDPLDLPPQNLDYLVDFPPPYAALGSLDDFAIKADSGDFLGYRRLNCMFYLDPEDIGPLDHSAKQDATINIVLEVQKEQNVELPKFDFNETIRRKICDDAFNRMPPGELSEALFPTVNELQRFFTAYLECFHPHFPIIHLPSFDLLETPSPLVFAICSIGALYQLERSKAKNLFALAGTMSSYALRAGLPITRGTPKPAPLWIMQTRVLLSLCGIFSEKTNVVMRTVENLGLFAIDYRLRRSLLGNSQSSGKLDWEEWISVESSKRLLCGMFIVSNLISTTFGINPGFSHTHDLEFDILDEERLWNARSATDWIKLKQTQTRVDRKSMRSVMADLLSHGAQTESPRPYNISGFTMLVIMHAINTHMWNLLQYTQMFSGGPVETSPLHHSLLSEALATLGKCSKVISRVRGGQDHSATWHESEGPIMFNCQALLRIAYMRIVSTTGTFNRLTLLTDNPDDVTSAVKSYAEASQHRSRLLTKSALKAFEGFLAPIKIGHLLVRKTAALSWSVEHAVAGWDAALFLTKWIHTIELDIGNQPADDEEVAIFEQIRGLLSEVESNYDGTGSLAAAVAYVWSTFFTDVWVWGVTPRMGYILQQLAVAYEQSHRERFDKPI
jgi:hypothetical protein